MGQGSQSFLDPNDLAGTREQGDVDDLGYAEYADGEWLREMQLRSETGPDSGNGLDGNDRAEGLSGQAQGLSSHPDRAAVLDAIRRHWPESEWATAERVVACESDTGQHYLTYDLVQPNAGPMQLNRSVWEPFFREKYGWTWERVIFDLETHMAAAREVWDRGWWYPWACF